MSYRYLNVRSFCIMYIAHTLKNYTQTISEISKNFREFEQRANVNQVLYLSNPISVSLLNARISSQGTPT